MADSEQHTRGPREPGAVTNGGMGVRRGSASGRWPEALDDFRKRQVAVTIISHGLLRHLVQLVSMVLTLLGDGVRFLGLCVRFHAPLARTPLSAHTACPLSGTPRSAPACHQRRAAHPALTVSLVRWASGLHSC